MPTATFVGSFYSSPDDRLVGPVTLPAAEVRRRDTGATVASGASDEIGGGSFGFDFTAQEGIVYVGVMDGDPLAAGQTVAGGRFVHAVITLPINRSLYQSEGFTGIHVSAGGVAGTVVGINGTADNPVATFGDAVALSLATGLRTIIIRDGTLTLDADGNGETFVGLEADAALNPDGNEIANSVLRNLRLVGSWGGTSPVVGYDCELDGASQFAGTLVRPRLVGAIALNAAETTVLIDAVSEGATITVGTASFQAHRLAGALTVAGMTAGTSEINAAGAQLTLAASNTGGALTLRGVAELADSSAGTTVDTDGLVEQLVDTELTAQHGSGAWTGADLTSLTALVNRILGLSQDNYMLDEQTYDAKGLLLTGRIRVFADDTALLAAAAGAADGADSETARYNIAVVAATPGQPTDYRVAREL